ncbi:MAG: N-formylglutamate amidohydrolase [Pseudomonadota bacterium]
MTVPPFEIIGADRDPRWLILCDHASNRVPPEVAGGDLGLPEEEMRRHIAWDVGARGVAVALAEALDAPMVAATFSRLVIDPNRGEDDPTIMMRLYDGTIVPGNRHADAEEKARRIELFHRPYHDAVDAQLDRAFAAGATPRILSVHSYTPQLRGRPKRPWHVGLLWDRDDRIFRPLFARLQREEGLVVGDNEPYSGQLRGDCLYRHATQRGLPHVLIELRHDLIETPEDQARWGRDLARWVEEAMAEEPEAAAIGG